MGVNKHPMADSLVEIYVYLFILSRNFFLSPECFLLIYNDTWSLLVILFSLVYVFDFPSFSFFI